MKKLIILVMVLANFANATVEMEREFERRCFEIGGMYDETDGYCDMSYLDMDENLTMKGI